MPKKRLKAVLSYILKVFARIWCIIVRDGVQYCKIQHCEKMKVNAPLLVCVVVLLLSGCESAVPEQVASSSRWYKGNLHTHTLWSDGDDYPEMVIAWYKGRGYDFLALSDHNVLAEGDKWVAVGETRGGMAAFERFQSVLPDHVVSKTERDTLWARLQTFDESSAMFNEEGEFLMIRSEEITDGFEGKPVHVNATNLRANLSLHKVVNSVRDVMQT